MKPHFLLAGITQEDRIFKQGDPIRDDPDSSGYYGKILKEGLKSEEVFITLKLVSSGNTSDITMIEIKSHIIEMINDTKIAERNVSNKK